MGRASRRKKERQGQVTPVRDRHLTAHDTSDLPDPKTLEGPTKVLVSGLYLKPKLYTMDESRIPRAIAHAKRMWFEEFKEDNNAILSVRVIEAPSQNPVELMKADMQKALKPKTSWRNFGRKKVVDGVQDKVQDNTDPD